MDIQALHFHGHAVAKGALGGRAESQEGAIWVEPPLKAAFSGS